MTPPLLPRQTEGASSAAVTAVLPAGSAVLLAAGEGSVILLQPPSPSVRVSIRMERGCH